jgi:hypothetical protein
LVAPAEAADQLVGEVVAVVGEARRGKTPNLQETPYFHVVCGGEFRFKDMPGKEVLDWPEDVLGKQGMVIGKLEKRYLGEANGLPIVESNFGYFLRDGTGERIEPWKPAGADPAGLGPVQP